jgi:hypothetical protein
VASDPFGISGRAIMAALFAGERDPAVLAGLARGSLRSKTRRLAEALTGRFTEHHAFCCTRCCTASTRSPPTSPPSMNCKPSVTLNPAV